MEEGDWIIRAFLSLLLIFVLRTQESPPYEAVGIYHRITQAERSVHHIKDASGETNERGRRG